MNERGQRGSVSGLHHVTAIARQPQANLDFYSGLLGLRLVKKTVNFDDPTAYHLYYGDEFGRSGSLVTFFFWPEPMARGRRGYGQAYALTFSASVESLDFWADRFEERGHRAERLSRCGEYTLRLMDPDGILIEIAGVDGDKRPGWGGAEGIPSAFALRGLHRIELPLRELEAPAALLEEIMGFRLVEASESRLRYGLGEGGSGGLLDLVANASLTAGRLGAGAIHHVAWSVGSDAEQEALRARLNAAGFPCSPIMDRSYFRSIYFREPGGSLFEIATERPGFAIDEPRERLGESLKLPPQFEGSRQAIEQALPPIQLSGTPGRRRLLDAVTHAGAPLSEARVVVALLHGRGSSGLEIARLAQPLGVDGVAFVAPTAEKGSWYPGRFLEPFSANEPALSGSLQMVAELLDELGAAGLPADRVGLAGFSQGACLALEFVARHPRRYRFVAAMSGALMGPLDAKRSGADLQGTPILLACAESDAHIPLPHVLDSQRLLSRREASVELRVHPGSEHRVFPESLAWISERLDGQGDAH